MNKNQIRFESNVKARMESEHINEVSPNYTNTCVTQNCMWCKQTNKDCFHAWVWHTDTPDKVFLHYMCSECISYIRRGALPDAPDYSEGN